MNIFRNNKNQELEIHPNADSRVEVELHRSASKDAAERAKVANQHLNNLLVENGFTLKIYLAAGGKDKRKH